MFPHANSLLTQASQSYTINFSKKENLAIM